MNVRSLLHIGGSEDLRRPVILFWFLSIVGFLAGVLGAFSLLFYDLSRRDYTNSVIDPDVQPVGLNLANFYPLAKVGVVVGPILIILFFICYRWGKRVLENMDEGCRKSLHWCLWIYKAQPFAFLCTTLLCIIAMLGQ